MLKQKTTRALRTVAEANRIEAHAVAGVLIVPKHYRTAVFYPQVGCTYAYSKLPEDVKPQQPIIHALEKMEDGLGVGKCYLLSGDYAGKTIIVIKE